MFEIDPRDPPRPGRKTFQQRFRETNAMSTDDIARLRDYRAEHNLPHGICNFILAQRRSIDKDSVSTENDNRGCGCLALFLLIFIPLALVILGTYIEILFWHR